ncbi:GIY-YIG nuclease family protein [Streptomyces erythrochromogenes]|uniref:GIY-YIG nuclease family protein n=1 Tax=Streptomyces erythrochromogenes TaxID=285574 RepID=UPI0036F55F51
MGPAHTPLDTSAFLGMPEVGETYSFRTFGKHARFLWTHKECPGCGYIFPRSAYKARTTDGHPKTGTYCPGCEEVHRVKSREQQRRAVILARENRWPGPSLEELQRRAPLWDARRKGGAVYVAGNFFSGVVKIGFTGGDPQARVAALQTGNPHKLRVLDAYCGEAWLERALHKYFEHRRMNGEWFDLGIHARAEVCQAVLEILATQDHRRAA